VQEILYVLTRRGRREDALTLARHLTSLFPDLLPVTREDIAVACDVLRQYPRLSVRDAIHTATMLRNGLKTVVSVDSDFDQVSQVRRLAPGAL
jgi:predicted nucleic acid-binding protein